jgi:heparan-alpha-glucosaminide N-acetyltransferase
MPDQVDGYTFVDLVLPGFLFVAGVAIPLALHHRQLRGESTALLVWHVTTRAAGLLFLGVIGPTSWRVPSDRGGDLARS